MLVPNRKCAPIGRAIRYVSTDFHHVSAWSTVTKLGEVSFSVACMCELLLGNDFSFYEFLFKVSQAKIHNKYEKSN